jgi:hypothetical protein
VPLQNRVNPFGELSAFSARGLFMGNRGGRFHTDAKTLTARRWASRQWICCVLNFRGRRREVWGRFNTELFFLDEPTALAAGHRPCFECRSNDAQLFAEKWGEARRYRKPPYAAEMDKVLHTERLRGRIKRLHRRNIDELPDGAFIAFAGAAFAVRGDRLLRWTPDGYDAREPRPRRIAVDVLTRRQSSQSCQLAMNRAGTRAQRISLRRQKGALVAGMIDRSVLRPGCVGGP